MARPYSSSKHNKTLFRLVRHLIAMRLDPESCWQWLGSVTKDGHPKYRVDDTCVVVSRIVLRFAFGKKISPKYMACRSCENNLCLRPGHLYLEPASNITSINGKKCKENLELCRSQYKLTREQALEIRFSKKPVTELMVEYGISKAGVYAIKSRKYWK